jgi:hypothetical protein
MQHQARRDDEYAHSDLYRVIFSVATIVPIVRFASSLASMSDAAVRMRRPVAGFGPLSVISTASIIRRVTRTRARTDESDGPDEQM